MNQMLPAIETSTDDEWDKTQAGPESASLLAQGIETVTLQLPKYVMDFYRDLASKSRHDVAAMDLVHAQVLNGILGRRVP